MEKLKALSIRQPWAEMIMQGIKTDEFRTQPTKIRGKVYIYASLGKVDLSSSELVDIENEIGCSIGNLPAGVIVGSVEITGCDPCDGGYAWHLENPIRLPQNLKPLEQPQPVWFHPFGRPDDVSKPKISTPTKSLPKSNEVRFNRQMLPASQLPCTDYHAKYLAYELTRRCASDDLDKLTAVLSDAQVDLNPHQIEAALFAFSNPFSQGAIR